jgi:uncharacterized membrane protein YbaN (DUF454 family)
MPGFPAIPFILLAAWCFLQSSEKLYKWLLNRKVIGKLLQKFSSEKKVSKAFAWFVISQLWVSLIVAQLIISPKWLYITIINILGTVASIFLYRFLLGGKWKINSKNQDL